MTRRFEGQKLKSLRITLKAKLTLERVNGKLIYLWHSCIRIYIILDKIWQWTYNIFSFFFRSQRINFNSFNGYCYDEFLFYSKLLCRWEEWFINFRISNVKFIVPFRNEIHICKKVKTLYVDTVNILEIKYFRPLIRTFYLNLAPIYIGCNAIQMVHFSSYQSRHSNCNSSKRTSWIQKGDNSCLNSKASLWFLNAY